MQQTPPAADHPEYNATAIAVRLVHEDLMILRVQPDGDVPEYLPGQYVTLGLLTDERRIGEREHPDDHRHRLVNRAYSISCPILDENGSLVQRDRSEFLEFYVALVRRESDSPPALTPRLFAMNVGHRLYMSLAPKGKYTLAPVAPDQNVIFVATGTGEAPHNAMLRELLSRRHRGRIAAFVSVRHKRDLAYLDTHRELARRFENYRYIPLTTREPENLDSTHPNFVGKRYLQDIFVSEDLAQLLGWAPDSANTHVFLCGNPAMIGAPKRDTDELTAFPDPKGMIETLVELGLQLGQTHDEGNIHFERYW